MHRYILCLGILMLPASACFADDLTDAIISSDPRIKLQSGTGAAFDQIYGPKEKEAQPLSTEAEDATTLPSYGLTTKDLLDPMGTEEQEAEENSEFSFESNLQAPGWAEGQDSSQDASGVYFGNNATYSQE